jgi:hypothetical protein
MTSDENQPVTKPESGTSGKPSTDYEGSFMELSPLDQEQVLDVMYLKGIEDTPEKRDRMAREFLLTS